MESSVQNYQNIKLQGFRMYRAHYDPYHYQQVIFINIDQGLICQHCKLNIDDVKKDINMLTYF